MRGSARPLIGVTVSTRTGWRVYPFFWWAVWRAGGRSRRLDANRLSDLDAIKKLPLDGLIIGGGDDLSVDLYGGDITLQTRIDAERDRFEISAIDWAEKNELPILGVCRGAQLLNVVRGGTLHQDAYAVHDGAKRIDTPLPRKTIRIEPGTTLAAIKGIATSRVNALHGQSVNRLGSGLRIGARDEFGIVQAIEAVDGDFEIGVQWHPEYLVFSRRDHALFRALVAAAGDMRR